MTLMPLPRDFAEMLRELSDAGAESLLRNSRGIFARGPSPSSACGTFSPLVAGRRATRLAQRKPCCPSPRG